MRTSRSFLLLLFGLSALGACTPEDADSHLESVGKSLDDTYQSAKESVQSIPGHTERMGEAAGEEMAKLYSFEYKVLEVPSQVSGEELEKTLAGLGRDRWDCFYIRPVNFSLQIICKRPPKTLLRYIPRVF